jgi:uncharacterized membrane protein YdfJ with MMPL/SSD domain
MLVYFTFIALANSRIIFFSHSFAFLQLLIIFGSVALYPLFYGVYSGLSRTDIYGYFRESFKINVFLVLFVTFGICAMIDYAFEISQGNSFSHP